MFKTARDFPFSPSDSTLSKEYVLRPNDILSVQILSNSGYQLVDVIGQAGSYSPITYVIKNEGFAVLPMLDSVYLAGYTITAAENLLSQKYAYFFVNPYIRIIVSNRRCLVYTGRASGKVVDLSNENMNLVEVLAKAGGATGGKVYKIKIIRGDLSNPKIIIIDLSTIDGMKKSNLQIDANDIIYVEPVLQVSSVTNTILPYLSLFTTLLLVYATIKGLKI